MKQTITRDQLDELTQEQSIKLNNWLISKDYATEEERDFVAKIYPEYKESGLMVLNIGQMIHFIDEKNKRFNLHLNIYHREKDMGTGFWKIIINEDESYQVDYELCDVLWREVKNILSKS